MGPLFGIASGGVYLASRRHRHRGALLPHLFTMTTSHRVDATGGRLFSVALSVELPRLAVSQYLGPRSPDFPLLSKKNSSDSPHSNRKPLILPVQRKL